LQLWGHGQLLAESELQAWLEHSSRLWVSNGLRRGKADASRRRNSGAGCGGRSQVRPWWGLEPRAILYSRKS
jgi:hypothetical protein